MRKLIYSVLNIVLVLILFTNCKLSKAFKSSADETVQIGGITFPKERSFSQSELVVGRRICAALKHKREYFNTLYNRTEKMKLEATTVNCDGVKSTSTFDAFILNDSSLLYSPVSSGVENYFSDILTDQSGAFNDLCTSLGASDFVLNTLKLDKLRYTINFSIVENYDHVDILKAISDGKTGFNISGAESVTVITLKTQENEKFLGVEKERTRVTKCENKKEQSLKQSWIGALTSFPYSK